MNKKEKENKELSERRMKGKLKGRYFLILGILALLCVGAAFGFPNLNTVSGAEQENSGESSSEYDRGKPGSFAGESPEENYIFALSYEYLTKYAEDNGLEGVDTELIWRISSIAARVIAGLGDMTEEGFMEDETYAALAERIIQEILSDEWFADTREADMPLLRELVNGLVQQIMEKAAPFGNKEDESAAEAEWESIRDIVENSINAGNEQWKQQIEEWEKEHWAALDSGRTYIAERLEKLKEEMDRVAADSRDGQLSADQRIDTQVRQLWTALESAGAAIDDVRAGLSQEWKNAYLELLKQIDGRNQELEGRIGDIGEQWEKRTLSINEQLLGLSRQREEDTARMDSLKEELSSERQNTESLVSGAKKELAQELKQTREELEEQLLGLSRQREEDTVRMDSLEETLRGERQNTESLVNTAKEEVLNEWKQAQGEFSAQVNGKEEELEGRINSLLERLSTAEQKLVKNEESIEEILSHSGEEENTAKFPNGLTMQWGTMVVESHETFPTLSQQVLLKQPFAEGDYVVMLTPCGTQDYLITHSVVRQDINGFEISFHIDCAGGGYGEFTWIAIGY